MDWSAEQASIMEWAKRKGWEDGPCDIPESVALIISELAEALEEHRNGHAPGEVYFNVMGGIETTITKAPDGGHIFNAEYRDKKPLGIPTEIADTLIRVLHVSERHDIRWQLFYLPPWPPIATQWGRLVTTDLGIMMAQAADILTSWAVCRWGWLEAACNRGDVGALIWFLEDFAKRHGFDLKGEAARKMAYNETRPFRHGGKLV